MTTKNKKAVENLEKTLTKSNVVDTAEQLELLVERVKKLKKFILNSLKNKLTKSLKQLLLQQIKLVFLLQKWLLKKQAWVF